MRAPARVAILTVVALVLLVTGCSPSATTLPTFRPVYPTVRPSAVAAETVSPTSVIDALAALQNRAKYVLGGTSQPRPLFIDWDSIETGRQLSQGKASDLCRARELPVADDALATIALITLNAVSERFRHKPAIAQRRAVAYDALFA